MNAPIRSMDDLIEAVRIAQHERGVGYETLNAIAGITYADKLLGPVPNRRMGPISTFLVLGALGKTLAVVDDPDAIKSVQGRWKSRIIKGGATLQMRARDTLLACALSIEEQRKEYMRQLGSKGGKMGGSKGGKRRMKTMSKRARQRAASHAARMRWAKAK